MTDFDQVAALAATYAVHRSNLSAFRNLVGPEAVVEARLALADALVDAGWIPPAETAQQLSRDRALIDVPRRAFSPALTGD